LGLNEKGFLKRAFLTKNWQYLKTVRDMAKVTINHEQEVTYVFSDYTKIIDLG